jgi:hypothetical protein
MIELRRQLQAHLTLLLLTRMSAKSVLLGLALLGVSSVGWMELFWTQVEVRSCQAGLHDRAVCEELFSGTIVLLE